jgi:hypothetical protein
VIRRQDQLRTTIVHALLGPLGAAVPLTSTGGPRTELTEVNRIVQEYRYREDDGKDYLYTVMVDVNLMVEKLA